jgi:serine protease inhibitor
MPLPALRAEAFELPLTQNRLSMVVITPIMKTDFRWMERHLLTLDFDDVFKFENVTAELVDRFTLPKIRIESDLRLMDGLKSLGLNSLFQLHNTDLAQSLPTKLQKLQPPFICQLKHLVTLDISEQVIVYLR